MEGAVFVHVADDYALSVFFGAVFGRVDENRAT